MVIILVILFAISQKPIENEKIALAIRYGRGEKQHLFLVTNGRVTYTAVKKVRLIVEQKQTELRVSTLGKRFFGRYFTNPKIRILSPSVKIKEEWQRQLNKQLSESDVVVLKCNFKASNLAQEERR